MQLPVFDIITEAIRDTWQGRRDFAAFAFLPVLGVAVVGTLMTNVIGDPRVVIENPDQVPPALVARMFFGITVNWIIGFALYTLFAVPWHRRTLIGPEATTVGAAMRWRARQSRFFRRLVVLIVNLMVFMFFASLLLMSALPAAPVLSALLIAAGLIYARVSLVLPAAAIDTPLSFREAATLTNGNSWRMMLAVVMLPLTLLLFGGIAVLLIAAPLAELIGSSMTAQLVLSLIAQTVNYFGFAVGITALSLAYKQLTA